MRSFGKFGRILLAALLTLTSIPLASAQQSPDMLMIDISPCSFDVNTPVDVTIKAVTANGDVVKDYNGDVFLDVGGLDTGDYTVPSEGLYSFTAQDQ